MNPLLVELMECLDLRPAKTNAPGSERYIGRCEASRHGRIFGGQALAQSLMAAGRTAPDRPAHSIQALFLEIGDPTQDITFDVERLRDGRSFSARRVVARQQERIIFTLQASFHAAETGWEHQLPAPSSPPPDTLPSAKEFVEQAKESIPPEAAHWAGKPRALEVRHTIAPSYLGGPPSLEPNCCWLRYEARLPNDPLLHQCLLAYASDIALNDTAYRPHSGPDEPRLQFMSTVDHSMWFHVPVRADQWILYQQESPRAAGARGFARGTMYTQDGVLIASTGQDSAMRPQPAGPPGG